MPGGVSVSLAKASLGAQFQGTKYMVFASKEEKAEVSRG